MNMSKNRIEREVGYVNREATMVCGLPSGSSLVLLPGAYVQAVRDGPLRAIFLVVTGVRPTISAILIKTK